MTSVQIQLRIGQLLPGLYPLAPPPLLYLTFALLLGLRSVGLEYDEALLQHGAVHILNSTTEPTFAHDVGSWVHFAGRYWPLAVIPYIGAVKDYLLLLPFAVLGPKLEVARAINVLLGGLGIGGIVTVLRHELSPRVAAATGFAIAIHPAYLDMTVYDNGAVVVWMAILGFICLTVFRYKKRQTAAAAFLIGLAMGIGVWNRVNFVWFLASALVAAAAVFRKKLLIPIGHGAALLAGAFIGVFPFLMFQVRSSWVVLRFIEGGQIRESFASLLMRRLWMLAEILISDGEHRGIWGGPPLPAWQVYFFPALLTLAVCVCLGLKGTGQDRLPAWRRASALTLILFALVMFSSRLRIAEHHLITLLPIAAVVVVLALQELSDRWKRLRVLAVAVALVYAGSALYWNIAAARGLRQTGGINQWSDAIYSVNDYLMAHHSGQEIKILDWGLQNNLYVLSNAKIKSTEVFWGATRERATSGATWSELVRAGGVFLANSRGNTHFPEASEGFFSALMASGRPFSRIEFRQKRGMLYAELIEIAPSQKEPTRPF